jgi:replicative DNA helicase
MPAAIEAEMSILGAIILENDLYEEARGVLHPSAFHLEAHRRIYKAMGKMRKAGTPIDTLTLAEEAGKGKVLEALGGVLYLSKLTDGVPRRSSIEHYVRLVQKKAHLRYLVHMASKLQTQALDPTADVDEIIGDVALEVASLVKTDTDDRSMVEVARDVVRNIGEIRSGGRPKDGKPTSLPDLDLLSGGYRDGQYIVIAARTSHGKSSLMRQGAIATARYYLQSGLKDANGKPKRVVIFTLEMTRDALVQCMLSELTGIDSSDMNDPEFLSPTEIEKLAEATTEFESLPLDIIDVAGIEIGELVAKAKWHVSQGAGLIFVDYLQLVRCREFQKDTYMRVTEVSAQLRDLMKLTTVVALCQLSRPEKGRDNVEPVIYDLKECGNIENDAVQVWMIYRPMERDERTDRRIWTGKDWIIVVKNRFGRLGHIPCVYHGPTMRFLPRTIEHLAPQPAPSAPIATVIPHYTEVEQLELEHDNES